MLTVQVRLLSGRYVATQYNDRNQAEWPPHPARLYSAALSAWADTGLFDPDERAALEWWEGLGAPQTLTCTPVEEVAVRSLVTHYVPVNDVTVLARDIGSAYGDLGAALEQRQPQDGHAVDARTRQRAERAELKARTAAAKAAYGGRAPADAAGILPERRGRQPRTYPSATPADEVIRYGWSEADGRDPRAAVLDAVLARIARLGHSSSPVDVAIVAWDEEPKTYVPDDHGDVQLRTVRPGQFRALVESHAVHQGRDPRVLPSGVTRYDRPQPERSALAHSDFGVRDWLVFEPHRRLPMTATLQIARTLRAALMTFSEQPPAEIISGHRPGPVGAITEPATDIHAAYVPLPFVGGGHGDGSVQAIAVILPRSATSHERTQLEVAVRRWIAAGAYLTLGRYGVISFEQIDPHDDVGYTARPTTWTRPSQRWVSVTPVALDRHPGQLGSSSPGPRDTAYAAAVQTTLTACRRVGLPEPSDVTITTDALIRGSRPARSFPSYQAGHGPRRSLVHTELCFDSQVRGPVILGAGRFFGYGLFRPTDGRRDE